MNRITATSTVYRQTTKTRHKPECCIECTVISQQTGHTQECKVIRRLFLLKVSSHRPFLNLYQAHKLQVQAQWLLQCLVTAGFTISITLQDNKFQQTTIHSQWSRKILMQLTGFTNIILYIILFILSTNFSEIKKCKPYRTQISTKQLTQITNYQDKQDNYDTL